jgi:hypothetical protein
MLGLLQRVDSATGGGGGKSLVVQEPIDNAFAVLCFVLYCWIFAEISVPHIKIVAHAQQAKQRCRHSNAQQALQQQMHVFLSY